MMNRIYNIQALRGIAALMVLSIHSIGVPRDIGLGWLAQPLWKIGPAGVDIFFVISGFIITTVAVFSGASDKPSTTIAREFITKRVFRIYPAYWLVFVLALLVSPFVFLSPDSVPRYPLWQLFFLIEPSNSYVMAAWTLSYELYFYSIVFAILLIAPTKVYHGQFLWGAITVAASIYLTWAGSPLTNSVVFNPQLIEFMLGATVAYIIGRKVNSYPIAAIMIGVLLFVIGMDLNPFLGDYQPWSRTVSFGPASACIVYGLVAAEQRYGWTASKPWMTFGDASYSIYIWHQLVIFTAFSALEKAGIFSIVPPKFLVPLWVGIAILVGLMSFYFFEEPINRYFRKRPTVDNFKLNFAVVIVVLLVAIGGATLNSRTIRAQYIKAVAAHQVPEGATALPIPMNPELPTTTALSLPAEGASRLLLRVKALKAGALYVGYSETSGEIARWYNFGKNGALLHVDIPPNVVANRVWLGFDRSGLGAALTEVWAVPR